MQVTPEILKSRTFQFALDILKFVEGLKHTTANDIMNRQIMRSATSVGANYRSACKAKSPADFINKLKIVEEETDETTYWLKLIEAHNNQNGTEITRLINESIELEKIFAASLITARGNAKIHGFSK